MDLNGLMLTFEDRGNHDAKPRATAGVCCKAHNGYGEVHDYHLAT